MEFNGEIHVPGVLFLEKEAPTGFE